MDIRKAYLVGISISHWIAVNGMCAAETADTRSAVSFDDADTAGRKRFGKFCISSNQSSCWELRVLS